MLGFLPLGTGNSFVRDHARDGIAFCRDALVTGRSRRVDLLRLRHRDGELLALGVVSLGFGADVASLVNRRLKPFGKLGYSLGVLAEVARLAPRTVRLAARWRRRSGRGARPALRVQQPLRRRRHGDGPASADR